VQLERQISEKFQNRGKMEIRKNYDLMQEVLDALTVSCETSINLFPSAKARSQTPPTQCPLDYSCPMALASVDCVLSMQTSSISSSTEEKHSLHDGIMVWMEKL
jgi:hypothetical protein